MTYIAPCSEPLHIEPVQYDTERQVGHHWQGVPGIFKFDIEPVCLTVIQCTTTFGQFSLRCVCVLPIGITVLDIHISAL